jgi:Raf kinase inhibitor-like YbhB/YbcL family protein
MGFFSVNGEVEGMKNLDVKLGFSQVPVDHTCEGKNISPGFEVHGLSDASTSMAIILDDPDAPSGAFVHWIIWNIPPTKIIPEAIPNKGLVTEPIEGVQGLNSFGKIGYMGPCPPPGKPHRYIFRVYGLDQMLELSAGASRRDLEEAMQKHIVQTGEAKATCGR